MDNQDCKDRARADDGLVIPNLKGRVVFAKGGASGIARAVASEREAYRMVPPGHGFIGPGHAQKTKRFVGCE